MGSNEASANPFQGEEDLDGKCEKSSCDTSDISYHDIATKLLNDNLLLTALELHAELVEAGKELPKLSVFFSNPGNFERHTVAKPEIFALSIRKSFFLMCAVQFCSLLMLKEFLCLFVFHVMVNFCSIVARSLSQATLDSLDLTRYSEDGERGVDERVAVLEFELRKAKETISALRANLTVATGLLPSVSSGY